MPITVLPSAPSSSDPSNFAARGDALLSALPLFVTEINALTAEAGEDLDGAITAAAEAVVSAAAALASQTGATASESAALASKVAAAASQVAALASQTAAAASEANALASKNAAATSAANGAASGAAAFASEQAADVSEAAAAASQANALASKVAAAASEVAALASKNAAATSETNALASKVAAAASATSATASATSADNSVIQATAVKTQTEAARDQALAGLGVADQSLNLVLLSAGVSMALDIAGVAAKWPMTVADSEAMLAAVQVALDLAGTAAKQVGGGNVQLGVGTVTEPSLWFAGDRNTGIYSPAPDVLAGVTGGVERWRVDANGTMTMAAGVATTAVAAAAITQTWGNAAIAFPGWKLVVTDTASAAGSMLMQVLGGPGGATLFLGLDKAGNLKAPNHVASAAAVSGGAGTVAYGGTTQTTVGANGAASALTALPLGYIKAFVGSTAVAIPYFNA